MALHRKHIFFGSSAVVGLLLVLAGIFLAIGVPIDGIINKQVLDQDVLGYKTINGSEVPNSMTQSWLKPPYAMQLQIWMFNITNVQDMLNNHAKPHLNEIGPFTFREIQEKIFHEFIANDTRVLYRNKHTYIFDKELSCAACELNMKVTIPNVVFQKLVDVADLNIASRLAVDAVLLLSKEGPFITVSVGEALFDGYHDPLVDFVCENKVLSALCDSNKLQNKIGFFYKQNGTTDGLFEVSTGLSTPFELGKLFSWNNMTEMKNTTWDTEYARMINGTDGQLFPPMLEKTKRLQLFAPQVCRTVELEYTQDTSFHDIPAYRYSPPEDLYDPAIPKNRQFCNSKGMPRYFDNTTVQIENCLPAGLIDLSRCQEGNPRVYLSQAHFYNSPKEVHQAVLGLSAPSHANDETYVDIEPISGVVIRAKKIMQVNIGMVNNVLGITKNMKNVIVPVLWINETVIFDKGTQDQLEQIYKAKHYSFIGGVTSLTIGVLTWLAILLVIVIFTRQEDDSEYGRLILDTDDNETDEVTLPQNVSPVV